MKIAIAVVAAVLGLALLWYISQAIAAESGEVVVLTTRDTAGEEHETRLWIVDHEGKQWLRAGSDAAGWYGRLRSNPEAELERNGKSASYTAVPRPEKTAEINRLMAEKYAWADRYIGFYFPRDNAMAIRLDAR